MSETKELRRRIEAEKKELEARIARLKVQGTSAANDTVQYIEKELEELQSTLSEGWDNLSESAARKLNDWLDRSKAA